MSEIEKKDIQELNKVDTLADMVVKKFKVPRSVFQRNNRAWLAKMAGVTTDEYNDSIKKYNGKTDIRNYTYNIKIRQRILDNDVLPLHDYTESLRKFDTIHQSTIKEMFTDTKINSYIGNLSDKQITLLNALSTSQLIGFLEREMSGVEEKSNDILKEMGFQIKKETSEQIANLTRLMDMQARLYKFISKYDFKEYELDKKTRMFKDKSIEEKFQAFMEKSKSQKEEYAKLLNVYGSEQGAEEYLRYAYTLSQIKESDTYKRLDEKAKKEADAELAGMIMDFYVQSQFLNIDLSFFDLEILYIQARAYLTENYGQTVNYRALMGNINADSDMTEFLRQEKYSITEIGPEEGKDKAYYKKLFVRYPELNESLGNGIKMEEYLEGFNDDMMIKTTVSQERKEELQEFIGKLSNLVKPYEERLAKKTNGIVQEFAVSQCVESLQHYMDVDVNAEKSLIEQLEVLEDKDAITAENGELLLKIQGMRNGKKTTLSYDLVSGRIYYHPYLYKPSMNETDPLNVGENNEHNRLPLTTIASLSTIIKGAKSSASNGEYQQLIRSANGMTDYITNIKKDMDGKMNAGETIGYEVSQDILKKQVIQDDIVQDVIACTGRVMKPQEEITTAYPEIYGFYSYLSKTLGYYSMHSVDKLTLLATDIKKLLGYRNTKKTQSIEDIMKYEEGTDVSAAYQNQEMFLLQSMMNIAAIPQTTNIFRDQGPEKYLLSFFKCFETKVGGSSIIDVKMMDDYFTAAGGTNKEGNQVGKRQRNTAFTQMVNDMKEVLGKKEAEDDLTSQLKNV